MKILFVLLCFVGMWLVAKKDKRGFLCWTASNVYWYWHNLLIREYWQSALNVMFGVFCIVGFFLWSVKSDKTKH